MSEPTGLRWPVHGIRLDPNYPYIEAEVTWACRREYAATAVDVIARRTRLAFLCSEAALEALPTVIGIMSKELGWNTVRMEKEFRDGCEFLESMGLSAKRMEGYTLDDIRAGRHKQQLAIEDNLISRTFFSISELADLKSKFKSLDADEDGKINGLDLANAIYRSVSCDLHSPLESL